MVNLSLTEQEAAVLRQLIDAAVRGEGLKVAQAGLYLDMKLAKAIEAATINMPASNGADSRAPQAAGSA